MLQNLHVKNLALIDEIEVDFSQGLNILTGETGAGKSIIIGSVNLALGGRYNKDILRKGAQYGLVELTFSVRNKEQEEKLKELDVFLEEGNVVLSRRLMDGRSVSRINGETVTMSLLKKVAEILIDIHGQHEHQSLLYKKQQLEILDAYAKDGDAIEQVKAAYNAYKQCQKELSAANLDEGKRAQELSFLQFEIQEIEEAALKEGEDEELEILYRKMVNGKKIAENANEAYYHTEEAEGVNASEQLSRALRCLQDAAAYDDVAKGLYEQLSEVDSLLNDFNRELSDYSKSMEFSEQEYYETEERLNEINRLKTKYGNTLEGIEAYRQEKEERLRILEDYDQYLAKLHEQYKELEQALDKATSHLTKVRKKHGAILAEAVKAGLQDLNFADVDFQITFGSHKDYTANGKDDVEFMISMNPGEPVKPLAEVASGGELSRIMLAIKTVMAARDDIETLIFDEIDVGISGRTAQKVSEKMAVIGQHHQVICITHLAQIAAMADAHYAIEKTVEEGVTRTQIRLLDEKEAVEELARILGGAQITDAVMENAREMRKLAESLKKKK